MEEQNRAEEQNRTIDSGLDIIENDIKHINDDIKGMSNRVGALDEKFNVLIEGQSSMKVMMEGFLRDMEKTERKVDGVENRV